MRTASCSSSTTPTAAPRPICSGCWWRSCSTGPKRERPQLLEVDNIVVCAGQEPVRDLEDELRRCGVEPHIIGGAAMAAELDAKRAIRQGTELAARL